jgi:DNA-binding CsgD family transcriptional regulator
MTVIPDPGTRRERGSPVRPLLEREAEVAALSALIEAARSGDGRLVVIEGAAGIGKTRLLAEARSLARGFEVLSARAGELESDFAFGVVRQLFESTLALAPADVRAQLLSGAAALATPLFALGPAAAESSGTETSFAMLHGLYWLAANFALRRPTLIAVDDLHWADEPSLRWLAYLARRIEGLPLLLAMATRPHEQARAPSLTAELLADPLATVIRPGTLGQESVAALAAALFGLQPDEDFAAALRHASGGNPLYLAAILDAVDRQQMAPTAEQTPRLLELGGEALSRAVALRLSRLSGEAVGLVRAAAILGDGTKLALAASLAEVDTPAALEAAGALVQTDLLERENPLGFRHPVVRSAVLEDISAGARMRLHNRAAKVLLDSGARPEQAATHLIQTLPDGDPFTVETLRRAAQRSLSHGAPEAAVAYLRRALAEPPPTRERCEVLAELGIAETGLFEADAAAGHLRQALDELDDIAERPDVVLAYVYAAMPLAGRTAEAVALLAQLSDRSQGDAGRLEQVEPHLILAASFDGRFYPVARAHWDAASARDREAPIRSSPLLAAGAILEARRGIDRRLAVELARRALASPAHGAHERLYRVLAVYALTFAGEVEDAESAVTAAINSARRAGDRFAAAPFYLYRAHLRAERGQLLAAEEDLDVPEVISSAALSWSRAYRAPFLTDVLLARGQYAEAEALFAGVDLEEVEPGRRVLFLCGRGRLHLETGRLEQALADFGDSGELAASVGIENPAFCPWRSQRALALHRSGQVESARDLAREELKLSRRWGAPRTIGVSLRALGLVEGGQTGEQLLRQAVEVLADSPARLEHARALVDLGGALRRSNVRNEARKHLREGIDLAHPCGATALAERGNEELAATGAHPRKVMLSGLESLTASERRVAQIAAEEVSNKEIAQSLFVTVKTVEVHLSRVYRKLDIQSRRELARALSAPAARTAVEAR